LRSGNQWPQALFALEAAEQNTGEEKQKSSEKSFKAMVAHNWNRNMRVANKQSENYKEH